MVATPRSASNQAPSRRPLPPELALKSRQTLPGPVKNEAKAMDLAELLPPYAHIEIEVEIEIQEEMETGTTPQPGTPMINSHAYEEGSEPNSSARAAPALKSRCQSRCHFENVNINRIASPICMPKYPPCRRTSANVAERAHAHFGKTTAVNPGSLLPLLC
jgi:hypothetical protein